MPPEIKALYEFGKFRCDPREHLLLFDGKPVSLALRAFEILLALVQSRGRLLTKDELMRQVWPDSFVEEANLTVNISALRRVLGEISGGQQFIETVPKQGYRFTAPVIEDQDGAVSDPPLQPYRVELGLVFDDVLRQGLSSQLEQSPFLNLLSDERIAQTL